MLKKHLIDQNSSLKDALMQLNELHLFLTLFVIDENEVVKGTITDGDIRRGLLKNMRLDDKVSELMNVNFKFLTETKFSLNDLDEIRKKALVLIPVVSDDGKLLRLLNFKALKSLLPLEVVMMAGGEGSRLFPLTEKIPKSMVPIGGKPILEHNIDRLIQFGISKISFAINHLGEQIEAHFGDGSAKGITIKYIKENQKQGTIGALSLLKDTQFNHILLMNADLLTNIDFESFFREFLKYDADVSVACFPYQISVPYATVETDAENIIGLKEKPVLTYYANAGIYLIKKECISSIPQNTFYEATQFIEKMIEQKRKVVYYPILDYWLDIGQIDDYHKAQEDIKHIKL